MPKELTDNLRSAWSEFILEVGQTGKALGRPNAYSNLPSGSVHTGKELGKGAAKSVWWVPDSGSPTQIGTNWEKFKKDLNQLGDTLAVDSPVAALKKAQAIKVLTIGGTVLVAIAGTVATVATMGAAAPAAGAATAAAAGSITTGVTAAATGVGTIGTIAGVGTVVGTAALAAGKLLSATPEGKRLKIAELSSELATKVRQFQQTPTSKTKERDKLEREIQSLRARIAMDTAEINRALAEQAQAGREVARQKELQKQVLVVGGIVLGGLTAVWFFSRGR